MGCIQQQSFARVSFQPREQGRVSIRSTHFFIHSRYQAAALAFGQRKTADKSIPSSPLLETVPDSPVSASFLRKVSGMIAKLPEYIRGALHLAGWRIVAAPFVTKGSPDLKDKQPPGWDSWSRWDDVPACCHYDRKKVIMAETHWFAGEIAVDPKSVFDQRALAAYKSKLVTPIVHQVEGGILRVLARAVHGVRAFRHDVGHAVDRVLGNLSSSPAFDAEYMQDYNRMSPAVRKKMGYYILPDDNGQPSQTGKEEAFAEAFGLLMGGGCQSVVDFRRHFKSVIGFVEQALAALKQRYAIRKAFYGSF